MPQIQREVMAVGYYHAFLSGSGFVAVHTFVHNNLFIEACVAFGIKVYFAEIEDFPLRVERVYGRERAVSESYAPSFGGKRHVLVGFG